MIEGCPSIELRFHGNDCVEAEREARRVAEQTGGLFISPYNDEDVVAGQVHLHHPSCCPYFLRELLESRS